MGRTKQKQDDQGFFGSEMETLRENTRSRACSKKFQVKYVLLAYCLLQIFYPIRFSRSFILRQYFLQPKSWLSVDAGRGSLPRFISFGYDVRKCLLAEGVVPGSLWCRRSCNLFRVLSKGSDCSST